MKTEKIFYFKHEYWGDDWQEYPSTLLNNPYDEEEVAEEVAEEHWRDDPSDPDKFEMTIEVKCGESGASKTFTVHAESDVEFFAREKK